jgi:hypothetical protein
MYVAFVIFFFTAPCSVLAFGISAVWYVQLGTGTGNADVERRLRGLCLDTHTRGTHTHTHTMTRDGQIAAIDSSGSASGREQKSPKKRRKKSHIAFG